MNNPKIEEIRGNVHASYITMLQLLNERLTLLDTSLLYEQPSEGEWTLMQNLAHINEIMPYWASEIEKLKGQPGQNFGRTMEQEARLKAISDHRQDTLKQAFLTLHQSYKRLDRVLAGLKDEDLQLTGLHSNFLNN